MSELWQKQKGSFLWNTAYKYIHEIPVIAEPELEAYSGTIECWNY